MIAVGAHKRQQMRQSSAAESACGSRLGDSDRVVAKAARSGPRWHRRDGQGAQASGTLGQRGVQAARDAQGTGGA